MRRVSWSFAWDDKVPCEDCAFVQVGQTNLPYLSTVSFLVWALRPSHLLRTLGEKSQSLSLSQHFHFYYYICASRRWQFCSLERMGWKRFILIFSITLDGSRVRNYTFYPYLHPLVCRPHWDLQSQAFMSCVWLLLLRTGCLNMRWRWSRWIRPAVRLTPRATVRASIRTSPAAHASVPPPLLPSLTSTWTASMT